MAFIDFTLEGVIKAFGLTVRGEDFLPDITQAETPRWLVEMLGRNTQLTPNTDKARGEFLVAPILVACRSIRPGPMSIYSGHRLDLDPDRGLMGDCDFLLTAAEPVPFLRVPVAAVVFQARKCDIGEGLGPCLAQMVAARMFNEEAGPEGAPIFGCVTCGQIWQFLSLDRSVATFYQKRHYVSRLETILAAFQAILARHHPPAPSIP